MTDNKTSIEAGSGKYAQSPEGDQHILLSSCAEQRNPIYMPASCFTATQPLIANSSANTLLHTPDNSLPDSVNDQFQNPDVDVHIDGENTPQDRVEGSDVHSCIPVEPQSLSNSRFMDRVSRKLSVTFGNPTVVHRTHLRPRPSVLCPEPPISMFPVKQVDGANDDSSDPTTTPPSSGGSPIECSTPWTPVTSAEPSPSFQEKFKHEATQWLTHPNRVSDPSSPTGSKSPITAPSIVTVEAASVAKVYIELYFNSIFQNPDARIQRQYELEQYIYGFRLGAEEQESTRRNWVMQENEYLRKCRAMKTRIGSPRMNQINQISAIAGYKVLKTLGRGSFGLVRLVREEDSQHDAEDDDVSLAHDVSDPNPRGRHPGMIRSAVDGARRSRRRFMTGEKKEVYAMKIIKKSDMIRNCQEGHIRAERDFLVASANSHWVVPLISSFQDDSYLYLVMDYMVGGDFLGLLIRKDTLREGWTRFYIAEMVLCIEEAHRLCWIHRDIKPDNFLISASGHLKISDFGLAFNGHWSYDQAYYSNQRNSLLEKLGIEIKGDAEDQAQATETEYNQSLQEQCDSSRYQVPSADLLTWRNNKERRRFARSAVGTSQYMAPEIIRGEMYDGRCDWWSLGVILYEVCQAYSPCRP